MNIIILPVWIIKGSDSHGLDKQGSYYTHCTFIDYHVIDMS